MSETKFTVQDDKKTLLVERTFNAPKNKVWAAYTEAELIAQWWGPKGWETEVTEMDFTEGGHWLYIMTCKDEAQVDWYGKNSSGKGVYKSISPKDSFEYTDYFTDDDGNVTPGMPTSDTKLEFIEENGSTTIISTTTFDSEEALRQVMEMGMQEGFKQTWDNLDTFLNK